MTSEDTIDSSRSPSLSRPSDQLPPTNQPSAPGVLLELDVPPAQVQKYSAYRPGIGAWFVMLAILMLVQRQNYWSIVGPVETTIAPRFRVDLNRAGLGELANLTEVGAVQASAIIDYRKQVGRFESIDQLRQVRGIGAVTLGRLRPFIYIEEHSSLRLASTPQSVAAP